MSLIKTPLDDIWYLNMDDKSKFYVFAIRSIRSVTISKHIYIYDRPHPEGIRSSILVAKYQPNDVEISEFVKRCEEKKQKYRISEKPTCITLSFSIETLKANAGGVVEFFVDIQKNKSWWVHEYWQEILEDFY